MIEYDWLATSAFGLEALVARELKQLGYEAKIIDSGRILFRGTLEACVEANLWLRTADRVLLRLGTFQAMDFGELFDQCHALPWEDWIGPEATFPVRGRSHKSQLSSVPACQKIIKKAIVEKLRKAHGVEELPEIGPDYVVEVALLKDQATLTIDCTGVGLTKRGYRPLVAQAPLRETLAAALIMLSYWKPDRPFLDPFCGSGTLPIEAAMIARDIAPGLKRDYVCESWPQFSHEIWQNSREMAKNRIKPPLKLCLQGSDIDGEAIRIAQHSAELAGVGEDIHFERREFSELESLKDYGCLITNPPYGERLGEVEEVEALYQSMPRVFRDLPSWSFYLLVGGRLFEKLVGQRADRRRKLYNARIECTFYQFHGPRPPRTKHREALPSEPAQAISTEQASGDSSLAIAQPSSVAADTSVEAGTSAEPTPSLAPTPKAKEKPELDMASAVFGGLTPKSLEQAQLFENRLEKRVRHLRKWPTKRGITCFRLYDKDIPEVPLMVDRYEDQLVIAEYERPHERSQGEHADWLDLMVQSASKVTGIDLEKIHLKYRHRLKGTTQYERKDGRDLNKSVVNEGGLKFIVDFESYLDTGLFLDHRETREMIRKRAKGKDFMNLFAYTGSFTVYAAAGGARSTQSVDLSSNYMRWAENNLELNKLNSPSHRLIAEDVLTYLEGAAPRKGCMDLVVIDPPTFSNSKKTEEDWDVQTCHEKMFRLLRPWLRPGAEVFFSTNFRKFKWNTHTPPGYEIHEISRQTVPEDFRNKKIHRCWVMKYVGT